MQIENKIIHGDSLIELKKLENNSIDLIVTSPPYFNVKEYAHWETYEDYLEFLKTIFEDAFNSLKEGRMCIVNLSPIIVPRKNRQDESKRLPLPFHFVNIMETIGYKFIEDIIWEKPEHTVKNRNGSFFRHRQPLAYKPNIVTEYILVFQKPMVGLLDKILHKIPKEIKENSLIEDGYERSNVWRINPVAKSKHPAPFPKELSDKLIKYYSFENETVLDMFAGSGTSGISAVSQKRKFILIEKNISYIELIHQNLSKYID